MYDEIYRKEINDRLKTWLKNSKMKILLSVFAVILSHLVLYGLYYLALGPAEANQKAGEAYVEILVVDLLGVIGTYFYLWFYKIPLDIYGDQKQIIDERNPAGLCLETEYIPNTLNTREGRRIKVAAIQVKSCEDQKIEELRAMIRFEHLNYSEITDSVSHVGYDLNALLFWDNDGNYEKEISLRPDHPKFLILCELVDSAIENGELLKIALIGSDPALASTRFSREAVFQVKIMLQGRLDGEHYFRNPF
jgi:hypothetical protein